MAYGGQIRTWVCRLLIAYQVLSSYWTFEYVDQVPFREDVKSHFQLYVHIWIWISIAFGLSAFIGIKNFFIDPRSEDRVDGGIYYDFLDVATRYAFLLCWMYYFIVVITWMHHTNVRVPPYGGTYLIVLAFIILILLAYVDEINIQVLQITLAIAHFIICFAVPNFWGLTVSIVMLVNSRYILSCTDPAPVTFNPTFIFTGLTLLSSILMMNFFRTMRDTAKVIIPLGSFYPFSVLD